MGPAGNTDKQGHLPWGHSCPRHSPQATISTRGATSMPHFPPSPTRPQKSSPPAPKCPIKTAPEVALEWGGGGGAGDNPGLCPPLRSLTPSRAEQGPPPGPSLPPGA